MSERLEGNPAGRSRGMIAGTIVTAAVVLLAGAILYRVTGEESERSTPVAQPAPSVQSTATAEPTEPVVEAGPSMPEVPTVEERPALQTQTQVSGRLPNGTPYDLVVEPGMSPRVEGVYAGIVAELSDGSAGAIGIVQFNYGHGEIWAPAELEDLTYTAVSGGWEVRIALYQHVVDALALEFDNVEELILESIVPVPGGDLPALELTAPFRWAEDIELPLHMAVGYRGLTVLRGCNPSAVACSTRRGVQAIRPDVSGIVTGQNHTVWIESNAPRPRTAESWLDPGPLLPRGGHQVLWTGQEMIVWGGATGDRPAHLVDGAAFDPATDQWRMLSPAPINAPATTHALWAGDEMLVLSSDTTVAYDPRTNSWSVVGQGIVPGKPIWDGASVVTVNGEGVHRFDRDAGRWIELPGAVLEQPRRR